MNSITQNSKNAKRYLPHDLKTKENAVKTYLNNGDIEYTCRKYHISRSSLEKLEILEKLLHFFQKKGIIIKT